MKPERLPGFTQAKKHGYILRHFDADEGTWAQYIKGKLKLHINAWNDGSISTKIELLSITSPTFAVESDRSLIFQEQSVLNLIEAHTEQKNRALNRWREQTVLIDDLKTLFFMAAKLDALLLLLSTQHPDPEINHKERSQENRANLLHWKEIYGIENETNAIDILTGATDEDQVALAVKIAASSD